MKKFTLNSKIQHILNKIHLEKGFSKNSGGCKLSTFSQFEYKVRQLKISLPVPSDTISDKKIQDLNSPKLTIVQIKAIITFEPKQKVMKVANEELFNLWLGNHSNLNILQGLISAW